MKSTLNKSAKKAKMNYTRYVRSSMDAAALGPSSVSQINEFDADNPLSIFK